MLKTLIAGLLVAGTGCATRSSRYARSPIPLDVVVRPECRGPRMGESHPELDLASTLARRLWQSNLSESSGVSLLKVELGCPSHWISPVNAMEGGQRLELNSPAPHQSKGDRLWLCLARDEDCELQEQPVGDELFGGLNSVAIYVMNWLKKELSKDAIRVAPGSTLR